MRKSGTKNPVEETNVMKIVGSAKRTGATVFKKRLLSYSKYLKAAAERKAHVTAEMSYFHINTSSLSANCVALTGRAPDPALISMQDTGMSLRY